MFLFLTNDALLTRLPIKIVDLKVKSGLLSVRIVNYKFENFDIDVDHMTLRNAMLLTLLVLLLLYAWSYSYAKHSFRQNSLRAAILSLPTKHLHLLYTSKTNHSNLFIYKKVKYLHLTQSHWRTRHSCVQNADKRGTSGHRTIYTNINTTNLTKRWVEKSQSLCSLANLYHRSQFRT